MGNHCPEPMTFVWHATSNSKEKELTSKKENHKRKGSQTAAKHFLILSVHTPHQLMCVFILRPRV